MSSERDSSILNLDNSKTKYSVFPPDSQLEENRKGKEKMRYIHITAWVYIAAYHQNTEIQISVQKVGRLYIFHHHHHHQNNQSIDIQGAIPFAVYTGFITKTGVQMST